MAPNPSTQTADEHTIALMKRHKELHEAAKKRTQAGAGPRLLARNEADNAPNVVGDYEVERREQANGRIKKRRYRNTQWREANTIVTRTYEGIRYDYNTKQEPDWWQRKGNNTPALTTNGVRLKPDAVPLGTTSKSIERGKRVHRWSDKRSLIRDCCDGYVKEAPSAKREADDLYAEVCDFATFFGEVAIEQDGIVQWRPNAHKIGDMTELYLRKRFVPGETRKANESEQEYQRRFMQEAIYAMYQLATFTKRDKHMGKTKTWKPYLNGMEELQFLIAQFDRKVSLQDCVREMAKSKLRRLQDLTAWRPKRAGSTRCFACDDYAAYEIERNGRVLNACAVCHFRLDQVAHKTTRNTKRTIASREYWLGDSKPECKRYNFPVRPKIAITPKPTITPKPKIELAPPKPTIPPIRVRFGKQRLPDGIRDAIPTTPAHIATIPTWDMRWDTRWFKFASDPAWWTAFHKQANAESMIPKPRIVPAPKITLQA